MLREVSLGPCGLCSLSLSYIGGNLSCGTGLGMLRQPGTGRRPVPLREEGGVAQRCELGARRALLVESKLVWALKCPFLYDRLTEWRKMVEDGGCLASGGEGRPLRFGMR